MQALLKLAPYLLNHGLDDQRATPLQLAARQGQRELVAYLLAQEAHIQPNKPDAMGMTPLHEAAQAGHIDIANQLLQNHADVQARSESGATPFYLAIAAGHLDMARLLLARGAKIQQPLHNGQAPLHAACRNGHLNALEWLLQQPGLRLRNGVPMDAPYPLNEPGEDGASALQWACGSGRTDIVAFLLAHKGLELNRADAHGTTPLHTACQKGPFDSVLLLLQQPTILRVNGAPCEMATLLNQPGKDGVTPLQLAARAGHEDTVALLLGYPRIQPSQADSQGMTALHEAARAGHESIVARLLERKANMNAQNELGCTPFYLAVDAGRWDVAKRLQAAGANILLANKKGTTPLHRACRNGTPEWVAWLLQLQPPIHVLHATRYGYTALHFAAINTEQPQNVQVLQNLLAPELFHKLASARDTWGATPLSLALEVGQKPEVIQALRLPPVAPPAPRKAVGEHRGWLIVGDEFPEWEECKFEDIGRKAGISMHPYGDGRQQLSWEGLKALDIRPGDFAVCIFHANWSPELKRVVVQLGKDAPVPLVDVALLLFAKGVRKLVLLGCKIAKCVAALEQRLRHDTGDRKPGSASGYEGLDFTVKGSEDETLTTLNLDGVALSIEDCIKQQLHGVTGNALFTRSVQPMASLRWSKAQGDLVIEKREALEVHELAGLGDDEARKAKVGLLLMHTHDGKLDKVKELLGVHGVPPNERGQTGSTALLLACWRGHLPIVRHLLKHPETDVHLSNSLGSSPLHVACERGHVDAVRVLLDHRANINHRDHRLYTPLAIACHKGQVDTVRLLLLRGAQVNLASADGTTPLHLACLEGHTRVVALLLEAGANPDLESLNEDTPSGLALDRNHLPILKLLRERMLQQASS